MEWDGFGRHQWFLGGKLNITVNALDRHANSERRNKVAFIWLGLTLSRAVLPFPVMVLASRQWSPASPILARRGERPGQWGVHTRTLPRNLD
jgi:hypothetical protein